MVKLLTFILVLTTFTWLSAQTSSAKIVLPTKNLTGKIVNVEKNCGYNSSLNKKEVVISMPSEREIDIVKKILSYTGLPLNFKIFSANIGNAAALIVNDERIILYDPSLLKEIDSKSNTYWASISILAHEIGHHLSGHTLSAKNDLILKELESDKFSGFVMYKMGATLQQSIAAITLFGSEKDTKTHPSKAKRIKSITEGWNEAAGYRYNGAVPPVSNEDFPEDEEVAFYTPIMFADDYDFEKSDFFRTHKDEIENPTIFEGTIMEVDDKYGGHPSGEPTTAFQVVVRKIIKGKHNNFKPDEKLWIIYDYPSIKHWSMIQFRWFETLLVPGRKVLFSYVWEGGNGTGYFQLNHIQFKR